MFAIGVGQAEVAELSAIASKPISSHLFNVADYAAIASIKDALVEAVSSELEGVYTGKVLRECRWS